MNWYLEVLKKYVEFDGRARRKEYWCFMLVNFLIASGLLFISSVVGRISSEWTLNNIYAAAMFIPGLAVSVRRLHDTNRSGWFAMLGLIPIIGFIILIVFFAQDSHEGENQYGPNPKLITA